MAQHIDPTALAMDLLEKVDASGTPYDDKRLALFHLVQLLIGFMEAHSKEVADLATESDAFTDVSTDAAHIKSDMARIQQWIAAHPKANMEDAKNDPEFQKDVAAFNNDMAKYRADVAKFADPEQQKLHPEYKKYMDDGMKEAIDNMQMIWDTKVPWHPDQGKSIGDLINGKDMDGLSDALFWAAKNTSQDKGGVFSDWNSGKAGAPGLNDVTTDFGLFGANFTRKLNTWGTYIQQEDQVGQNFITSAGSLINLIIQNLRAGG